MNLLKLSIVGLFAIGLASCLGESEEAESVVEEEVAEETTIE